jgi:hypothetical protein
MNSSKLASAINIFSGAEKSDSSKFKIEVLNKDLPDGICPAGAPLLAGLALLAALTLTGGNAWAAGSGVLDLSAWSYALTDLAPQDGIAPGIVISDLSNGLTYRSNIVYQSMSEQTWNSLPLSWTGASGSAFSVSSAAGLSLAAQTAGPRISATGERNYAFSLSPNTALQFFLTGSASAAGDAVNTPQVYAYMTAGLNSTHAAGYTSDTMTLSVPGTRDFTLFGALESKGEQAIGTISLSAAAIVWQNPLPPVPEPASYVMLLAGLALLIRLAKGRLEG